MKNVVAALILSVSLVGCIGVPEEWSDPSVYGGVRTQEVESIVCLPSGRCWFTEKECQESAGQYAMCVKDFSAYGYTHSTGYRLFAYDRMARDDWHAGSRADIYTVVSPVGKVFTTH